MDLRPEEPAVEARTRQPVGLRIAGALVVVSAGCLAGAALPSAAGEREGASSVSFDLQLDDVEVAEVDREDDEREFVTFDFEGAVDRIVDEQSFFLVGLAAEERAVATTAVRNEDNPSQVIVGFEPGTDVASFRLGTVRRGAVVSVGGEGNPPDSVPLADSSVDIRSGRTIGPDLVGIRPQTAIDRAVFVFDENLDEDARTDGSDFGFYTESGAVHRGDRVLSLDDDTVTVSFGDEGSAQLEDGVRFFVVAGAVTDAHGTENPAWELGEQTARPDLEDVDAQGDGTTWRFEFDEEVAVGEARRFLLVSVGGETIRAEDVVRDDEGAVFARFPGLEDVADEIVLGTVLPGAVEGALDARMTNTLGVEAVEAEDLGDGPTIGPDFQDVDVDVDRGLVRYVFDEDIDADSNIDASDFAVITRSGQIRTSSTVVASADQFVVVELDPAAVEAAEAFTVAAGAVRDELGHENPLRTIGG